VPLPVCIGKFETLYDEPIFSPADAATLGSAFHGIAREWGETPAHWAAYGAMERALPYCDPKTDEERGKNKQAAIESWADKKRAFRKIQPQCGEPYDNWSGFLIKCYK